jgi:glycosyltransferase involved in cell wall biosynthesis
MKISVVIPCRNEVQYLGECIQAIQNSEITSDIKLSIIVVDGMSDDGTRELLQELLIHNDNLYLVDNVKQLTPFAFNLGINYIDYDYIQIVGARHILSSNYIQKCYKELTNQTNIWCVGGRLINVFTNQQSSLISKAMSHSFGMGVGNFRTLQKSDYTDTVTSPMYPKFVFEKIGLFDENLVRNQDDDFNYRITKAGGKIWYEHSISLKYYVRGNLSGLKKQFFQYGYWKVFVNKKHKAITTFRQMIPPLFVLGVSLAPLLLITPISILRMVVLFFLSLYMSLLLFFSFRLSNKFSEFILLIRIFCILHFSYGFGYLKGIYHFLIIKRDPSIKEMELSR